MRGRAANVASGLQPPPANSFSPVIALWALAAAMVCCVPLIYQIRWLFIIWLPLLAALPFVAIVWLVRLVGAGFRRRWKRALSLGLAGIMFAGFMAIALTYSREIHFQTMRPFYLIQVADLPADAPKKLSWRWTGGSGYDESLEYDETDANAPPAQRKDGVCDDITKPMGGHFYLRIVDCGGDR